MAPLIALIVGTVVARLAGFIGIDALNDWQPALRVGLAVMFTVTGVAHFTAKRRGGLIAMVPPKLPRPDVLVTVTGVLELAGAVGLLIPWTAPLAAVCLAALLLALYPANLSAARRRLELDGKPVTALVPRTLLQVVFVAACVLAAI
jgi:uncharacterized membrane protein